MSSLPKLMLDTNVLGKLQTPAYSGDLEAIIRCVNRDFHVVVSPQTFLELLNAIRGGDGTHFVVDQDRLRLLAGTGTLEFLHFPVEFALRKVLGLASRSPEFSGPSAFRLWFRVAIHAKSRDELSAGDVRLPADTKRRRWGMKLGDVNRHMEEGIKQHREQMEKAIGGRGKLPMPDSWASGLVGQLGHELSTQEATRLANRLDAAYRYASELCSVVAQGQYNFEKHRGDWFDWQQLFYLCDPDIHLLTDDSDLRRRVGSSPQREHILDFREFLVGHGFTPRH